MQFSHKSRHKCYKTLSQTISLALNSLKELLFQDVVGGVEGNGHSLATCGGHRKGLCVPSAYDINGNLEGCGRDRKEQVRRKHEQKEGERERERERRTEKDKTGMKAAQAGERGKQGAHRGSLLWCR